MTNNIKKIAVCGLDIGYGNVKWALIKGKGNDIAVDHFRSTVKKITKVHNRGADSMTKRDMLLVSVDDNEYLVGKQSQLSLPGLNSNTEHLQRNYIDTPQHEALYKGVLSYIGADVIELLVTGLPVDHYDSDHKRMRKKLTGRFEYPNGKSIIVQDVWVIPQPVGGFIDYFMMDSEYEDISNLNSLTIDVGHYTLDWIICTGMNMQEERSGSIPGGMSLILERLAELPASDGFRQ